MRGWTVSIIIFSITVVIASVQAGEPAKVKIEAEPQSAAADGVSVIKLKARVEDAEGKPVPDGTVVTFLSDKARLTTTDLNPDEEGVQVATRGGVAQATLEPSLKPGKTRVIAKIGGIEAETTVSFTSPAKPFILVGLGTGKFSQMQTSKRVPSERREFKKGLQHDEKISLFLKARLEGGYLLTGAYDSSRRRMDRLFRELEPERLYPIYGDSSSIFFEAVSSAKGYLKLERGLSYAMMGDYNTEMNMTEFSAYDRALTGVKLNVDEPNVRLIGFASQTDRRIVRDEIPGQGISGYYSLSHFPVIRFSEKVRVEVRDRLHPERIISSEPKYRFLDYDIDYEEGTILFKQPIPRYDSALNDVVIVVLYEAATGGKRELVSGGYGELYWKDPETGMSASIGGTYVRDLSDFSRLHLGGVNGRMSFGGNVDVSGEVAWSQVYDEELMKDVKGEAWKVELSSSPAPNLSMEGYYRQVDDAFRNPVASPGEIGTTKYGLSLRYRSPVYGSFDLEHSNTSYPEKPLIPTYTGLFTKLILTSASYRTELGRYSLRIGAEDAITENPKGETAESLMGIGELKVKLSPKLSASVLREQNLLSEGSKFLSRKGAYRKLPGATFAGLRSSGTTLGLDYAFGPKLSVYARGRIPDEMTDLKDVLGVVGVRSQPSKGLSAYSEYRIGGGIGGDRGLATIGLRNRVRVRPDLTLNLSAERARAIDNISAVSDFDAASLSLEYLPDLPVKGAVKYEARKDELSIWNLLQIGGTAKLEGGISIIVRHRYADRRMRKIPGSPRRTKNHTIAGLAVRPERLNYLNLLAKVEYKSERDETVTPKLDYDVIIGSVEGVLHPAKPFELFGKYAVRRSRRREMNFEYTSTVDLWIARSRIELNRYVDVAGEYRLMYQRKLRNFEHGAAGELGFWFIKNLRMAVGYNFLGGSKDKDFPESEYWTKGPYVRISVKM
ncbi:TPA: hypothetical protein EYP37_06535 [Candidatus Poribacteria bacterium]|nr:hypothetical protein [Candidatus Poribacteria bacterium]